MIYGKRVHLRAFDVHDIPKRVSWMNDPDFRQYLNAPFPVSEASTRRWLDRLVSDPSRIDLLICLNEGNQVIGYLGFRGIDLQNQKAETYIGIGERAQRGKGYAKEAHILSLSYIFNQYPLNMVYVKCRPENTAVIAMNKSVGFHLDGVIRSDLYSHGGFRDMAYLTLLRDEFHHRSDQSEEEQEKAH